MGGVHSLEEEYEGKAVDCQRRGQLTTGVRPEALTNKGRNQE